MIVEMNKLNCVRAYYREQVRRIAIYRILNPARYLRDLAQVKLLGSNGDSATDRAILPEQAPYALLADKATTLRRSEPT
jgi:hypothetical protein